MTNYSGVPRPFGITDARRRQEEDARRTEQAVSARNTSSTTIGAGGRLDLDGGDLDIYNGANTRVRDGGRFLLEGGGSMDITDDGQLNVIGQGRNWLNGALTKITASLANRVLDNAWIGFSYLVPGLYFTPDGEARGALDPRVVSDNGKNVTAISAVEKLPYGPQVGPNIMARGTFSAEPWLSGFGAQAWDDVINPGGGDGVAGVRGAGGFSATPFDISLLLTNHTEGPDGIPAGPAIWVHGDLEEGVLHLYGRAGVDVSGPFTVDGQPVGGAPEWDDVQHKPTTFPPSAHTHTIANVTGLQTAMDGKSATNHTHAAATTTVAGFMSAADKSKLNGIPAGGGAVTSVAGKTGAVTLVKADVGLSAVDNTSDLFKPVSNATQTALNGKAATNHTHAAATQSVSGFMSVGDKVKIDNATADATPNTLIWRDAWGRAKIADPVGGTDIVNHQSMMAALNRGEWVKLGLAAGWSDYTGGGGFRNGLWIKVNGGNLDVMGMVKGGAIGSVIAILPALQVPDYAAIYAAVAVNAPAAVNVIPPESAIKYVFGTAAPSFLNFTMSIPLR